MTGKLDWSTIEDTFDLGGYSVDAALTDSAAFLAILGLTLLQPEYLWQDYEDFDDVETAIDDAIAQIMNGSLEGGEMQKLEEKVYTSDIAEPYLDDFELIDWRRFKLVVQGMRTNYASNWPDTVEVEYNGITSNNAYSSFNQFEYKGGQTKYEQIQNYPANLCYWVAAAELADDDMYGTMELDIYNPRIVGAKQARMVGGVMGISANKISFTLAQHGIFAAQKLFKILLRPLNGTSFVVGDTEEPQELRLTLYGWE